jgi:hypothetical protein
MGRHLVISRDAGAGNRRTDHRAIGRAGVRQRGPDEMADGCGAGDNHGVRKAEPIDCPNQAEFSPDVDVLSVAGKLNATHVDDLRESSQPQRERPQ